MSKVSLTSKQRVETAMSFQEGDRVPFILPASLHGAKELQVTIKEYFSKPEYVVEGQLRLKTKINHDAVIAYPFTAIEAKAWGGEVVYYDDGPPNNGELIIKSQEDILNLTPPKISESDCLKKILKTTEILKEKTEGNTPVIGVVVSPFSLPVMQMGFEKYIELIYDKNKYFDRLIEINKEFCINWANAQIQAGADAIMYYDPVSSPTIVPKDIYVKTGYIIAKETLSKINSGTATHFASGLSLPLVDELIQTGTNGIGISTFEDLEKAKKLCYNKLTVIGNLNAIDMVNWDEKTAEEKVKEAIKNGASGGGFILSDNHGEIPFQVEMKILMAISEAVHKWGQYPLNLE